MLLVVGREGGFDRQNEGRLPGSVLAVQPPLKFFFKLQVHYDT